MASFQDYILPPAGKTELLEFLCGLRSAREQSVEDDGVTQRATVKSGITQIESKAVPNPVELKPFWTFPEVQQPPALFVFRLTDNNGGIQATLYPVKSRHYEVEAAENIAEFFRGNMDPEILNKITILQ